MRINRRLWRLLAVLAGFALIVAACGDDSDSDDASDTTEADSGGGGESDGVLSFGTLLPETGDLAFLGPPEIAGAQLAVDDLNAAGGVLGEDVPLSEGDSGDTNTDIANQTTDRLLSEGVDAIVGAASSGVSATVIDKITGANVIQFSPANTAPDFTDYDDNGLYFRTAPSDIVQGRVLADIIIEDANESLGILAREDPYGEGLAEFTQGATEESGAEVTSVIYDPSAENFDAEIGQIADADPDAIALIGFEESAQILTGMFEAGLGEKNIYLVDGNMGNALGSEFDPADISLEGIRGTAPAPETTEEIEAFHDRMLELDPEIEDFTYGPETYDIFIITALAAEIAGTDNPVDVAAEIVGVTKDGTVCTSFEECRDLIADGEDIDYDGVGGPYEFIEAGEPSAARISISQYGPDNQIDDSLTEFREAAL